MNNEYKTLGAAPVATPDEIREAYIQKMKEAHPDKGGSVERSVAISAAYNILHDIRARKAHDTALQVSGLWNLCLDCSGRGWRWKGSKKVVCKFCGGDGWKK